jgi:hypothetical protein
MKLWYLHIWVNAHNNLSAGRVHRVDALHGQHVVDARVQPTLVHHGDARGFGAEIMQILLTQNPGKYWHYANF